MTLNKILKAFIIMLMLIINIMGGDKAFAEQAGNYKSSIFTLRDIFSKHSLFYFIKLDSENLLAFSQYNDKSADEYNIYNIRTGKLTPCTDDVLTRRAFVVINLKDNELAVFTENKNVGNDVMLYNYETKEIKYFKGYEKTENRHWFRKINDSEFVYRAGSGKNMGAYKICSTKSMNCNTLNGTRKLPNMELNSYRINNNKLLFTGIKSHSQELYLYNISTDELTKLKTIHNDSTYSYFPDVYKNTIAIINQNQKRGTELWLYKLEGNEYYEVGKYPCSEIPKDIKLSVLFFIDEKHILLFGGKHNTGANSDIAYMFNTKTKTFTNVGPLPVGIFRREEIKMDDNTWILEGYRKYFILLDVEGLKEINW